MEEKNNPFEHYDDINIKRMQVVYLNFLKKTYKEIAKITDYAVSTVRSYCSKFCYLLEEAKNFFNNITYYEGSNKCYLFKFFKDNRIIFSKIGTTVRSVETRFNEVCKTYLNKGIDFDTAEIDAVVDCPLVPPEGVESYIRASFIKKYPHSYVKNDRFAKIDIPTSDFVKIANEYLA